MRLQFVVFGAAMAAMCLQLVSCCEQEFCSEESRDSYDPDLTYTSNASGCEECNGQGGFGGLASPVSSSSSAGGSSEVDPWGPGCDWCSGPGCEDLDEACILIESESRALVCRDKDSEPVSDQPSNLCFTATERHGRRVLCCFDPS